MYVLSSKNLSQSGKTNYFYHYSSSHYNQLKSSNKQLGKNFKSHRHPTKMSDVDYGDNISLFIERPPLDVISKLFNNHPFWKSGKTIYEHQIDKNILPKNLYYEIVETPERYLWTSSHKELADSDFDAYLDAYYQHLLSIKLFGYTKTDLLDKVEPYYGRTRELYIAATKRNPNTTKYALEVPHIMSYPESGVMAVHRISQLTLP